jgi:hypothetical protein
VLCVTLPDPKPELIALINLQLAIFGKGVLWVVTDAERRNYWRRHDRLQAIQSVKRDARIGKCLGAF